MLTNADDVPTYDNIHDDMVTLVLEHPAIKMIISGKDDIIQSKNDTIERLDAALYRAQHIEQTGLIAKYGKKIKSIFGQSQKVED